MSDIYDPGKDFDPATAAVESEGEAKAIENTITYYVGRATVLDGRIQSAKQNPSLATPAQIEQWTTERESYRSMASQLREKVDSYRDKAEHARGVAQAAQSGCLTPSAIASVGVIAIIAVIAWILLGGPTSSEDETNPNATATTASRAETPEPGDDTDTGGAGNGAADLSSFAGRWVLVSGLDREDGTDVPEGPGTNWNINVLGPASAEFTIAEDGTVVSGHYQHYADASGSADCPTYVVSADLTEVMGLVTGPDGAGTLSWTGDATITSCVGSRGETDTYVQEGAAITRNFWITGDRMTLCSSAMETPTTCVGEPTRAIFERR